MMARWHAAPAGFAASSKVERGKAAVLDIHPD
jgi:hypothetical protein